MRRAVTICSIAALTASIAGCGRRPRDQAEEPVDLAERAVALTHELLLVDTHIDVPYRLEKKEANLAESAEDGNFDFPRARAGGLDAAFMSIYVPASYQESGGARAYADRLIDRVEKLASSWPDKFALADSPDAIEANFRRGVVSLPMGLENGAAVEEDLENLAHFAARGIRYITLTHSENNQIADSSYAEEPAWGGLSPFGREVVAEMNRLGIMVDVSHISDDAFEDVEEIAQAPLIASHSSCRHFTPGWQRNLSDPMIRRLAATGGVVQINFGSAFLRQDANTQAYAFFDAQQSFLDAAGVGAESEEARAFGERWWREHDRIYADVRDVADHIDHVVELAGIDHVGLGSDFEGVGDSLPTGLKDVSQYPNLVAELLERGYSEQAVGKILGGNLLRVWRRVERVARELREPPPA